MDVEEVVNLIDALIEARLDVAYLDDASGPAMLNRLDAEKRCKRIREELSEALVRGPPR